MILPLMGILVMAVFLLLPPMASRLLLPPLLPLSEHIDFNGEISSIGPFRTLAGPFVLGPADAPFLSIGTIRLSYTPISLVQKKISRISISDVTVHAVLGPDGITFPGMTSTPTSEKTDLNAPPDASALRLLANLGHLEIQSGMLILDQEASRFRIPFEMDLLPHGPDPARITAKLKLFPRDQPFTFTAHAELGDGPFADIQFHGQDLALGAFSDLVHKALPGLDISGLGTFTAGARVTWAHFPLTITGIHGEFSWNQGKMQYQDLGIIPDPETQTTTLAISSEDAAAWQMNLSGLQVNTDFPIKIQSVSAFLDLMADPWSLVGTAQVAGLPALVEKTDLALETPLDMAVSFSLTGGENTDDWTLQATAEPQNSPAQTQLCHPLALVLFPAPTVSVTAAGNSKAGRADWTLSAGPIKVAADPAAIDLPSVTGNGTAVFRIHENPGLQAATAAFQVPGILLSHPLASGTIGKVDLSGEFSAPLSDAGASENAAPETRDILAMTDVRLRVADGRIKHLASGLQLTGIRLDTPITLAPSSESHTGTGTFSVSRIELGKRPVGTVTGRITQTPSGVTLAAEVKGSDFPGLIARLNTNVRTTADALGHTDLEAILPAYGFSETDLGKWLPAMGGTVVSGKVSAKASGSIRGNQVSGVLDMDVADGSVYLSAQKMTISGIQTKLEVPDIAHIRTAPAQLIRFSKITMGTLVVDGGQMNFQVESPDTLFVEKGQFSWCGGKVDVGSLRITQGRSDYTANLYCQRISLSRVLEQFGSVSAKGTGTLNGRLPISYKNGRVRVDDGFLFSTPGEDGKIQITGTDDLTAGIPTGTPQFGEIELAREALKDYIYHWAKLGLVSEGEDLILRLQFEGKPAGPLPFAYENEIGGFIRVGIDSQGSVFQGIGLDINLRLPLDQILRYKNVVQ
ncbi:YdbH domain-containing protein [Desulfosarcina sp. OttesenSCG-928-A07]|nr:YdbH domain-containing protein [Desulfosarcina sp. OttesenSCG-928-A07]